MKFGAVAARFALVVSCALAMVAPAQARFWQCAPYAREISGVEIFGNAHTWWGQAAGKYERGHAPKEGAVLSFAATSRMRLGHVAMVSKVVSDREVLLTHANWSRRGGIERDVRAIDVSSAGDWSEVKVWYGPVGGLGTSAYPANGFIYAKHAVRGSELDAPLVIVKTDPPAPVQGGASSQPAHARMVVALND
ncbi:MAG: CHAP domain-containing protein [Sphingomonas paucimobilis]